MKNTVDNRIMVLFLTNNSNTKGLYDWIAERANIRLVEDELTPNMLKDLKPDIVISYNYSHIVSQECIDAVNGRIINMHCSYLPWNRGASPNLWSFIYNTPKGVTIHMLESGLDKGDILYQRRIEFHESEESFESAYCKLQHEMNEMFKEKWHEIESGEYQKKRRKQLGEGSYHSVKDLRDLKEKIEFKWSDNIESFISRYKKLEEKNI